MESLHDEERLAGLVDAEVVDRDDCRVFEAAFLSGASRTNRVGIAAEHFHGNVATDARIASDAHLAHATASD